MTTEVKQGTEETQELEPCPFCRAPAIPSDRREGFWRVKHERTCFFVIEAAAPSKEPPMLIYNRRKITAWNTRDSVAALIAERDQLLNALRPLYQRIGKMTQDGPECDCPAEGHMCGWSDLQREMETARAALEEHQ